MSFDSALQELASARSRYEAMRTSGAALGLLVEAQVDLLYRRAEIARLRRQLR